MEDNSNKCIVPEEVKNEFKSWAITLSELVLACCIANGIWMVLLMWFIISCIVTASLLYKATDENGNRLDTFHMMNTMSTDEWTKTCKKIVADERKKRWQNMTAWLLAIACFSKILAMFFAKYLGVTVVTWL